MLPQFGGNFRSVVFVDIPAGILRQRRQTEGTRRIGRLHILLSGAQLLPLGHAPLQRRPIRRDFPLQFRRPRRFLSDVLLLRLQPPFRARQRRQLLPNPPRAGCRRRQLLLNPAPQLGGFGGQRRLLPFYGALQRQTTLPQLVILLPRRFLPLQLLPRRIQPPGAGHDGIRPFRQLLVIGNPLGDGGNRPFRLLRILPQRGNPPHGGGNGILLAPQFRHDGALLFRIPGCYGDFRIQLPQPLADTRQFRRRVSDGIPRRLRLPQSAPRPRGVILPVRPPPPRRLQQNIVKLQPQNGRQHILPLRRRFAGELIRPPLRQKRRVDESSVVHTHNAPDAGIRFPQRVAGDSTGQLAIIQNEQIGFRPPPSRAAPPPDDPIGLPLRHKIQLHPALGGAVGNQRIIAARPGARHPPQTPGHRIQQRRLPMPVAPAQARHMNPPQIQRRQPLPVAQKIA